MKELRIFFWAAMHDPEFKLCYIRLPLSIRTASGKRYPGRFWSIEFSLRPIDLYIPWRVEDAYNAAHGLKGEYDDIPF